VNPLKTYNQINREDKSLSFGISRMEDIYEKRNGLVDVPHRHNYYTVLFTIKAKGKHIIDFKSYLLSDNQIFFIRPGQVHQVIEYKKSIGFSIVFSNQFLVQNNIPICFIDDLNLFNDFGETPPLSLNEDGLKKLKKYVEEIWSVDQSDISFKPEAIGALLKLMLICCNNLSPISKLDFQSFESGNTVLETFKSLVNKNYTIWHNTRAYANKLNITPDHLNRVVKSLTGKTAKEHIQSRIIIATKRLLYFTNLSSKEIGYKLGFSEPANFSAFFKKCTGTSPSKFKDSI
jgi:AraC family transcriptional regulator, transcriptional activator of pobA